MDGNVLEIDSYDPIFEGTPVSSQNMPMPTPAFAGVEPGFTQKFCVFLNYAFAPLTM